MESPRNRDLARVVVIGSAGSGKTTFARSLANILGVPHIELDTIYWGPNWKPRRPDEFRELVAESVVFDRWVLDGNYSAARDVVWSRATIAVWLNYPFILIFWRVFTRTLRRIISREELFSGNRESLRGAFLSRQSLLWWVITTHSRRRRQFRALFDTNAFPELSAIEFRWPSQAERFLRSLSRHQEQRHR